MLITRETPERVTEVILKPDEGGTITPEHTMIKIRQQKTDEVHREERDENPTTDEGSR